MQRFLISLIGALFCGYLTFTGIMKQGSESNLETTELKTMLNVSESHATPRLEEIVYAVKVPLRGWNDAIKPYIYLTLNTKESPKDMSSHLTVQKENNVLHRLNFLDAFKEEKAYYDFINPIIGIVGPSNELALAALPVTDSPTLPVEDLSPFARARSPGTSLRYLSVKYYSDV